MAVSGTYKTSAATPMGKVEGLMVLEVEDGALRGTMNAMGNVVDIRGGKVSGDTFEFDVEAKTPMGNMKITVKGEVDGDTVSGNFITSFGQLPFEGTRTEG